MKRKFFYYGYQIAFDGAGFAAIICLNVTCMQTNPLFLVEGMFGYVWREGIFSKCHIKICIKSNQ